MNVFLLFLAAFSGGSWADEPACLQGKSGLDLSSIVHDSEVAAKLASDASLACDEFEAFVCTDNDRPVRELDVLTFKMNRAAFKQFPDPDQKAREFAEGKADYDSFGKIVRGYDEAASANLNGKIPELRNYVEEIRSDLISTLNNSSSLTEDVRAEMISRVKLPRVVLATEFFKENRYLAKDWLMRACGPMMLKPYAANITVTDTFVHKDDHYLVLCPALVGITRTQPSFARFVIGHELGHAIDAQRYYKLFAPLKECVFSKLDSQKYFFIGGIGRSMDEVSADDWGYSVIARGAEAVAQSKPGEASASVLAYLKNSLVHFCYAKPGYSHPSGSLRIQELGSLPSIRKILGCKKTSTFNGCYSGLQN